MNTSEIILLLTCPIESKTPGFKRLIEWNLVEELSECYVQTVRGAAMVAALYRVAQLV